MEDGVAVKCLMISCLAICYPVEIAGNVWLNHWVLVSSLPRRCCLVCVTVKFGRACECAFPPIRDWWLPVESQGVPPPLRSWGSLQWISSQWRHSLNHSNINNNNNDKDENQPQFNTNTNISKNVQSQLNPNEILNSNLISIEHSNKIKLIQTAYRNYILHKNLNTNAIKHTFKYSSNIFNFSVNNPSVEALNIKPKEKLSSHAILDSHDINLKDETYLNGVQFDSNNNNNTNNNTTIENTETIPDNYELTQQRANRLFPLFTSIANDISLLYRINKITQTQHNNNNNYKELSSPPSSLSSSHDIIENDNEVFN